MICAHCSTPVADEARFCHSCGSLVSDAEGQAAATAVRVEVKVMEVLLSGGVQRSLTARRLSEV